MIVNKPEDIQKAFSRFITPKKIEAFTDSPVEKLPVVAKLNYTEVGVCPYCKTPMTHTEACGQKVYLCEKDRFVSPLPNAEL